MEQFAGTVIRHRRAVIILFIITAILCAALYGTVQVNYNMAEYLPSDAQSTKALELLGEFARAVPNASVQASDVSLQEALLFKERLAELEYVTDVQWLDDVTDLTKPLEMGDQGMIESYYRDGNATYSVVIAKGFEKEGVRAIRDLLGDAGTVSGDAVDIEFVQSATGSEVMNAITIVLPVIILILILSTTSWIEPLLFLAAIGVSVLINMGTNAIFGSVSFLTNAVTPILQLAVSFDYAIFLLHSFDARRKSGVSVELAMREAVKESFSTVAASASTTLFGFLALLFMDFRIGADLGMSLAKGILFSFISVMVFLPALTLCVYKVIDKTRHRTLMPSFANVHGLLRRLAVPAVLIILVVVVPSFMGQSRTDFLYGYQSAAINMRSEGDENETTTAMVVIVPKGDRAREDMLSDEILSLEHVTSVMSYTKTVGLGIPPEFLDASITEQFYSEHYARLIVYTDTPAEGEAAFATVEAINAAADKYYPSNAHTAGQSANLYDMRNVVKKDNTLTNLLAIVSIFIVLLITFKSATLPLFLLFTIETAIWINLSIPYFTGTSINYVGYLVLNTVQLGATVDYAILLTVTYMKNRQTMPKKEAIHQTLGGSFRSILVSAATLATAGFTLASTSSNPLIGDIGMLLGRGTLLSMLMVVVFLPAMLTLFDGLIEKTTYHAAFFKENKQIQGEKAK